MHLCSSDLKIYDTPPIILVRSDNHTQFIFFSLAIKTFIGGNKLL